MLAIVAMGLLWGCSSSPKPAPGPAATGPIVTTTTASSVVPTTGDAVLLAAGDIASCESTGDEATAPLVAAPPNATVITLGDNVYDDGTARQFRDCYEPSWGPV
ncbi:MAG: hypothetical protein ACRD12_07930, partial [Acidimicrobiales bacterium]